jgi:ATP sulfurylase
MRNFPRCGARRIPIDDTDTELVLRVLAPELAQEPETARCARSHEGVLESQQSGAKRRPQRQRGPSPATVVMRPEVSNIAIAATSGVNRRTSLAVDKRPARRCMN